ncbi:MAG: hypothetical protein M1823_008282, partial [Watsoniomyces obsoletus]
MSRRTGVEEKEGLLLHDAGGDAASGSSNITPDSRPSGDGGRPSVDAGSITSASTTSLVLENINVNARDGLVPKRGKPKERMGYRDDDSDPELPRYVGYDGADEYAAAPGGGRM